MSDPMTRSVSCSAQHLPHFRQVHIIPSATEGENVPLPISDLEPTLLPSIEPERAPIRRRLGTPKSKQRPVWRRKDAG
jgi:hypothetical protein